MEYALLIARSVTYAQRMQSALAGAGIRCWIFRAPLELVETGCAYAVELSGRDLTCALSVLRDEALYPMQVYVSQEGDSTYQEVSQP